MTDLLLRRVLNVLRPKETQSVVVVSLRRLHLALA